MKTSVSINNKELHQIVDFRANKHSFEIRQLQIADKLYLKFGGVKQNLSVTDSVTTVNSNIVVQGVCEASIYRITWGYII